MAIGQAGIGAGTEDRSPYHDGKAETGLCNQAKRSGNKTFPKLPDGDSKIEDGLDRAYLDPVRLCCWASVCLDLACPDAPADAETPMADNAKIPYAL